MPLISIREVRGSLGDAGSRIVTIVEGRPSFLGRALAGAAVLAGVVLALGILAVLLIPALVIVACALLAASVRRSLARARGPNGALDGRRNVRVIVEEPR